MSLKIDFKQLGSRVIRQASTGPSMTRVVSGQVGDDKLTVVRAGGGVFDYKGLGGWWVLSQILYQVPVFVRGAWSFNWNATDEELDTHWANFVNNIAGLAGGVIGNAAGWLVCGAVPGVMIAKFNKVLGMRILAEVGEEMLEELSAGLWNLCRQLALGLIRAGLVNLYKSTRRAIKRIVGGDSDWAKGFKMLVGDGPVNAIKNWGEKGSKPWSFAIKQEEFVESFPVPWKQNLIEETIEEFQDSCEEAWYVVAANADQWIQETRFNRQSIHGELDVLEIYPDRENEEEKIVLAGPQELLKPVIVNTITQYQMMEERDLGMWVGEPLREIANKPPMSIQMRILMSSKEGAIKGAKRVQITIPDVNKSKIDWAELKEALGGQNGYMWGRFRGKAKLSGGLDMIVHAATGEECIERLNALVKFSNQEILGITTVEEVKEGNRKLYDNLHKKPTRIYPYSFTIINQTKVLNEEIGIAQLSGIYKRREASSIPLYTTTKPDDFNQILQDLFYIPGSDD